MKHLHTVEDFVSNEYFQQWVLEKDPNAEAYWKQWIASDPEAAPVIEEAKHIIISLHLKEDLPSAHSMQEVWKKIQTQNENLSEKSVPRGKWIFASHFWQVAAVIMLLLAVGITFWKFWSKSPETITYTTEYGQTRQLILPDSSVVLLNANSTLHYLASWDDEEREVWLEGEAFFQVSRQQIKDDTSPHVKFLVHTDPLDVEVVGTAFNVNTRREKIQVVLNHGQVHINIKNKHDQQNLVMQPGEMIEYANANAALIREQVDTVLYTAWINKKLIFEDWTLEEIAHALEDNFGYEIIFADPDIRTKRFTGSIPTDDVELLFPMLSRAFNLNIERKQQQIIFSNK